MRKRIRVFILASLSGTLTACAFPKWNLSFFAWISLIPLLFILLNKSLKQSFFLGITAGFFHYGILLYWIPFVPAYYGNLPVSLSILIYLLFTLLLSLIWAFFSLFYTKVSKSFPILVLFLAPFLWISLEYILTFIFSGFPWCLLGYSQWKNIYLIQMASITGVYGLSFILVLFQSMFVYSLRFRKKSPFFAALGLVLLIHVAGYMSIRETPSSEESFTAAVIQGNVPSETYWGSLTAQETWELFNQHLELSTRSAEQGAELIVWSELSVPLCFSCTEQYYVNFKERLFDFVRERGSTVVLGTVEMMSGQRETLYHNAALALQPDLSISYYYKIHLVPFGEYTPYKKIFFFLEKMTTAIGDLTPGTRYSLHTFKNFKFGSPICYEIIFPQLVRKFVKKGAHFLVTITNDGWYKKSSAPYQHFAMAVFRAVENRRFLIRAATTGISGFVDPYGRILAESELMTQTHLLKKIAPIRKQSFYTKFGDVLPVASSALVISFIILSFVKKRKTL